MLSQPERLPRIVEPMPDELPISYLARLAWANGFENAGQFTRIVALKGNLRFALPAHVAGWLTNKTGLPLDCLKRYSIPAGVLIPFGEGIVRRPSVRAKALRFCEMCLRDDVEQGSGCSYIRGPWQWQKISHCHVHGSRLSSDDRNPLSLSAFEDLQTNRFETEPSFHDSDRYFYSRLHGGGGIPNLDQYPAYLAAEFCELLGQCGQLQKKSLLVSADMEPSLRIGFDIARRGPDAVYNFLTDHVRAFAGKIIHPRLIYAPFLTWWTANKHDPNAQMIMQFIQRHAEDHVALGPGDQFVWPVGERKIHSVKSASREYQITEDEVMSILRSDTDVKDPPYYFAVVHFEDLLRERRHAVCKSQSDLVDIQAARHRLAVSSLTVSQLADDGIISAIEIENQRYWRRKRRRWFRIEDLDNFAKHHVSLDHLAAERNISRNAIMQELSSRGIRPVAAAKKRLTPFYRRVDLRSTGGLEVTPLTNNSEK